MPPLVFQGRKRNKVNDFKNDVNDLLECAIETFGEEVTYYPVAGGVHKIIGVLDQNYEAIDPDTEQVITANQPVLGVNLNQIPFDVKNGDRVRIKEGVEFRVIDSREDGQGGSALFLQRLNDDSKTNKRAYSRFT